MEIVGREVAAAGSSLVLDNGFAAVRDLSGGSTLILGNFTKKNMQGLMNGAGRF